MRPRFMRLSGGGWGRGLRQRLGKPILHVLEEFVATEQCIFDLSGVNRFSEYDFGARLPRRYGCACIRNRYSKRAAVGSHFPRSFQQKTCFQSFIPISHDDIQSPAGQFLQGVEDYRAIFNVKFKLVKSLAYLSRSLLVRGEQKRDRQHNNETTCPACLQQDYVMPRHKGSLAA